MTEFPYTGERAVPWNPATGSRVMHLHVMRYAWALPFCHNKRAVDLGCGCGYGAYMLSWVARDVLGVDVDTEAVKWAQQTYQAGNLRIAQGDVSVSIPAGDVYVAFELLEHLDDPWSLVESIEGTLVWSVPVHDDSTYHKHVFSAKRAERDFGGSIYWQSVKGTIVPAEKASFPAHHVLGVRVG